MTIDVINDYQFQIIGGDEIKEGDHLKVNIIEGVSGETVVVDIGLVGIGRIQVYSEYGTKIAEWYQGENIAGGTEYELSADVQYRFVVIPDDGYVLEKWVYTDDSFVEVDRYYDETIYIDNISDGYSITAWIIEYVPPVTTTTTTETTTTTTPVQTTTYVRPDGPDEGYVYLKVYIPVHSGDEKYFPNSQGKVFNTSLAVGVNTSITSYQQWTCPPDPFFGYYYGGQIIPNLEHCYVLRVPEGTQVYLEYLSTVDINLGDLEDPQDDITFDFSHWKGDVDDYYTAMNKKIVLFMDEDKKIYCDLKMIGGSGGVESIVDKIDGTITDFGMNNTVGYWIITIAGMFIAFFACRNDKNMRIVMPAMVLGLGVVIGWLSGPLVVLLVIVAGVVIAGFMKNKITGQ